VGKEVSATCVTSNRTPFSTMMEEERGQDGWRLPTEDMWLVAPVSRNHSEALGSDGTMPVELCAV
jgi:hypothetical protein